jgi:hypothetical protein
MKITKNYIFSFLSIIREKDEKPETKSSPKPLPESRDSPEFKGEPKAPKYTFNLDKRQKETNTTIQKRFLYNFIENMRLKTLSTIVNKGI